MRKRIPADWSFTFPQYPENTKIVTIKATTIRAMMTEKFKAEYVRGAGELELVRSGLDDTMRTAYQSMRELWHSRKDVEDLRVAAYLVSIGRVAASYRSKGL